MLVLGLDALDALLRASLKFDEHKHATTRADLGEPG